MDATVINSDCRHADAPGVPYVVITDPPWPSAAAPVEGCERAAALLTEAVETFGSATRWAIVLGCDVDPAAIPAMPVPFFRACWLPWAAPVRRGRLLGGTDVAYLYGAPPKARPGHMLIPGEAPHAQPRGRVDHPCPRGHAHMRWLVDKWTEPDDVVVDPFAGSGTTLIAAKGMGRRSLGYEIDPAFCAVAERDLAQGVIWDHVQTC